MIMFVDLYGHIWEIKRREDVRELNELIETDDAYS
jgi:hypothetical protein